MTTDTRLEMHQIAEDLSGTIHRFLNKPGLEKTSQHAQALSKAARTPQQHSAAHTAHLRASAAHALMSVSHRKDGQNGQADYHQAQQKQHFNQAVDHFRQTGRTHPAIR